MKKALSFVAAFAMTGLLFSCGEKADPAVTATIAANDVTVEEGSSVQIGAATNSSASITYTCDDTAVATVDAAGTVTGVKAGSANITLKVAEVEGKFTAAEKTIKVTVTEAAKPAATSLTIDGKFDDWAGLAAGTFSKYFGDEDSTHPALTAIKVYANTEYIYVYFEWDTDMITYEAGVEHVPFHCYINTDGSTATGGFSDQFSDAATDVLLEGFIYPDGELGSYDPGAFSWAGDVNGSGWKWDDLGGEGFCEGAGVEGKYEFYISRAALAAVGFPVADVFSIGFDIQQSWDSVGILPSEAPSESNSSGIAESLKVVTQK